MDSAFTNLPTSVLLITTTLALALAWYGWLHRGVPGGRAFALLTLAVSEWTLAYAFELRTGGLSAKLLWAKLQYVGISITPVAWLLFTAQYSGHLVRLTRTKLALLLAVPATTLVLVLTNDFHRLVWREISLTSGARPLLVIRYGPWFWEHAAFSYALIALGGLFLVRVLRRNQYPYQAQAGAILVSALAPWLANIAFIFARDRLEWLGGLDLTPFGFLVSAIVLGWSLFRYQLLSVMPIADRAITSRMSDGVIVLDSQRRVVDVNPVAEQIIGLSAAQAFSQPIEFVAPYLPNLVAACAKNEDVTLELAAQEDDEGRIYEAHITPLRDWRQKKTGFLIVLHDMTERLRVEQRQRFLAEAGTLLNASLDYDATIKAVTHHAVPFLADWCGISSAVDDHSVRPTALSFFIPDAGGQQGLRNQETPFESAGPIDLDRSQILHDGFDPWLARFARSEQDYALLQAIGLRSLMVVPMQVSGRTLGVMAFGAIAHRRYHRDDLMLAEELGRRAALALENARLYQKMQRRMVELTTLQRIARVISSSMQPEVVFQTVVSQISEAFGYEMVSLYLVEGDILDLKAHVGYDDILRTVPLGVGIWSRVMRTGKPAFVLNVHEEPDLLKTAGDVHQSIVIPLVTGDGDVLGTFRVDSTGSRALDEEDVTLLTLLADQVSIAVTNARLFEDLRRSEEAAGSATRAKSELLANVSHEIRTPLNSIIGVTDLLLRSSPSSEQHALLKIIRAGGSALHRIINDILDFSKIESGKLTLQGALFSLRPFLDEAFDLIAVKAAEKQIDLAYEITPHTPENLHCDRGRLQQILVNLLENAVKFTDAGSVLLSVRASHLQDDQHEYRFAVQDTGIGIPSDRFDRLFQPFSQVDPASSRASGGAGLGLALSKRLCEMMGGTIAVSSQPGQGSTFTFSVVASTSDAQPAAHTLIQELLGKKALIVDRPATSTRLLCEAAERFGLSVQEMRPHEVVLAAAGSVRSHDVVILGLPSDVDPDEWELARAIGAACAARGLPLIVLGTLGQAEAELRAMGLQFRARLTRPVKLAQLEAALRDVFAVGDTVSDQPQEPVGVKVTSSLELLRVLVAEDDPTNQTFTRILLERLGCAADVVSTGVEVLRAMEHGPYDAVLLDVHLPEKDGLETARAICRRWPEEQRPYLIALTASAIEGTREACIEAGMHEYLSKPIDLAALTEALGRSRSRIRMVLSQESPPPEDTLAAFQLPSGRAAPPAAIHHEAILELQQMLGAGWLRQWRILLAQYFREAPTLISDMWTAVAQERHGTLRQASHRLKSSSHLIGARGLARLCAELEEIADGATVDVTYQIQLIEREYARVRAAPEVAPPVEEASEGHVRAGVAYVRAYRHSYPRRHG